MEEGNGKGGDWIEDGDALCSVDKKKSGGGDNASRPALDAREGGDRRSVRPVIRSQTFPKNYARTALPSTQNREAPINTPTSTKNTTHNPYHQVQRAGGKFRSAPISRNFPTQKKKKTAETPDASGIWPPMVMFCSSPNLL